MTTPGQLTTDQETPVPNRPRLLDAFCCQGGASAGYAAAGFDVTGIDLNPQPRYPYRFIQGDAIAYIWEHGHEYDAIAGSPPCQGYSDAQVLQGREHPMLIAPTREAMKATGRPYILENVPGARPHLIDPVVLCGLMFDLGTYRDRYFEPGGGLVLDQPHHPRHDRPITKMGRPRRNGEMAHYVGNFSGVQAARDDLGVPWMNRDGIRECIPPAYTEFLGRQVLAHLGVQIPAAA